MCTFAELSVPVGMIDAEELNLAMKALGFQNSQEEVSQLIQSMDKDGDVSVDLSEFMQMVEEAMNKDVMADGELTSSHVPPCCSRQ